MPWVSSHPTIRYMDDIAHRRLEIQALLAEHEHCNILLTLNINQCQQQGDTVVIGNLEPVASPPNLPTTVLCWSEC